MELVRRDDTAPGEELHEPRTGLTRPLGGHLGESTRVNDAVAKREQQKLQVPVAVHRGPSRTERVASVSVPVRPRTDDGFPASGSAEQPRWRADRRNGSVYSVENGCS